MSAQRFDAVIFDLYGTLVDSIESRGAMRTAYDAVTTQVAQTLGAPVDGFLARWRDTYPQRMTGASITFEAYCDALCRDLGVTPEAKQLAAALELRLDLFRTLLHPRPDAVGVLRHLRALGLRLGLISDCSWETPLLWRATPLAACFDTASFSCDVGVQKPDPRIYALTCRRLGVKEARCLFVGDGGSDELAGAERMGMTALRLRAPYEPLPDHAAPWRGPTAASMTQVAAWIAASGDGATPGAPPKQTTA